MTIEMPEVRGITKKEKRSLISFWTKISNNDAISKIHSLQRTLSTPSDLFILITYCTQMTSV